MSKSDFSQKSSPKKDMKWGGANTKPLKTDIVSINIINRASE